MVCLGVYMCSPMLRETVKLTCHQLPLFIFILGAMVLNGAPAVINGVTKITHAVVSFAAPPGQVLERAGRAALEGL